MNRHRCGGKPNLLGLKESIELPNYFLKPHETASTPIYRGDRNRGAKVSIYF